MKNSIPSSEFSKIFNNSRTISSNEILFKVYKGSIKRGPLISFAINKRLGPAHQRNLFKRRIRSLFNSSFGEKNNKIAMIIIPKSINLGWKNICASFELLQKKYDV